MKLFDSHFHIIEPNYPLIANNGFTPDFYTITDYQAEMANLDLEVAGGVVVSGSFQKFDQSYLEHALAQLGENFVGITQLPTDTSDETIARLDAIGVRGIRFNLYRGLSEDIEEITAFSERVYELAKWRTEFYLDVATLSQSLEAAICQLPKASIDHLGMGKSSSEKLAKFLAEGVAVKVTGFGRIDYSRTEIAKLLPKLFAENPDALLFGSDLPGTRARERFSLKDLELIQNLFSEEHARKILLTNGQNWYLRD